MENLDSRFKNAPYFSCEKRNDLVPVCQKCETCILAWKIFSTKEWFRRISEVSQRWFLVSVLKQLNSLYLLHYFQNILQTTQGKDFIYSRSRIHLSKKEGKIVKSSLNQMLDKTVEQKMKEILCWFGSSTHWTKANYTLLLLQMCDPKLLLTAANVVRVLFLRERSAVVGLDQNTADVFFFPEKDSSSKSEPSHVYWTVKTRQTSFPLSKAPGKESWAENVGGRAPVIEGQWKSSLQCISEMNRLFSRKTGVPKAGGLPFDQLIDLDAVRDLSSGFSQYRDFIRHLPIHVSKYILSMLDKNTLNKCASVSQHWAALAHQVKMDLSMHTFIQSQVALLQGSYTRGIDPNYANKLSIPVPKMADDGKHMRVKNQKWKLRTKTDYNLWTAYQNQETLNVQMEERNVYCGTYNIRILSDTWDRNRVIHYSGGDLVAVSSNRKIQLLDIIQVKEIPVEFRGHAGSIRTLFLCEEENFLLSGSYDLSIRYWDLKSGTCIRIFNGHQGTVTCMDLYKNKLVSGARDCQVKVWDLDTGKCLKTFKHKDPILATRISDTYIVSSCERGMVKVWHVATAQLVKTLNGHEGAVKCLCFDQWHLLSGSADGLVMAWSMVGKYERCLMAFKHPKMVINTESNIIMFQFENIKWQYSQDRVKQKKNKDKEEEKEENSLADAVSKSSIQAHSLRDSASSKQIVGQEALSSKAHRSRVLLKAAMLSTALIMSTPIQEKLKSSRKDGKKRSPTFKEPSDLGDGQEDSEAKSMAGDKMNADDMGKIQKQRQLETPVESSSCPRKKGWHTPMSPDQFLLTVNALQQAHNSGTFAYPRRPQTQVIDAWGPSISHPRKVLSFKGKSLQPAVDGLRLINSTTVVKQTTIPLEIQKLQPNLKNSLHSPRVQSTIPQPTIIRSRLSGSFKGEEGVTSSLEGAARTAGHLTSMHVLRPNRMVAPRVGTTTLSLKKERPRFYTALDPFRMNTGFMLLTVKEEKEYGEAKMKEYQARESTRVADPEKARKTAWLRKIKGLPIDNFMKQGKIAAPELGQNTFI
ncbi:F-box and WD repeat domain containing protein 10B isoform X2 [Elephas maximus indicus]|uniref:F-box and WD repeat domain containing protein 10B isoform X2 n=1 Tax=Elephas maximus indicus TaxID=99487 RepID=UPI0021160073|nr:F-box and WD repeat domain containing protein 10B isoform X2 [Elephas maximus indicus]